MEYEKTVMNLFDLHAGRAAALPGAVPEEEIAITKGLPTPHRGRAKYPFRDMELGDSFFAPGASVIGLHGCARRHRPKRFTCRTLVENGVAGVRVWRIV
ncbi:hypothetical protein DK847_13395 [Aestuariivirga litoralis]|uniref:Uncharacterized protein n=1 Tax=Aestuariivirga litoralis TaxID=2650924 RepID=A0A2W2AKX7_9HYPH|nr:hypothetical protein [Aestuariivirga litoralis]PZF76195.1 hypothetical protein DK847_13395 [Aestuariivirga litoralis]